MSDDSSEEEPTNFWNEDTDKAQHEAGMAKMAKMIGSVERETQRMTGQVRHEQAQRKKDKDG